MQIDFGALGSVFVVALVASVVLVVLFSIGVRLLSIANSAPAAGSTGTGTATADAAPPVAGAERALLPRLGAVLCFALCAAGVLFGVWLIVPFFH
ncbi:hypothetical protein FJ656_05555 [Schumannella luteola]|nr:hypothetical protein FJ656_05555 [Schumannella luteola]